MGKATVTWVQNKQFVGTDTSKHSVVISSQDEENDTGMKPSDLLLVSLASCSAYDVVNILTKKRKNLHHLQVNVEGEQQQDPPWVFTKIHLHYAVVGEGLSERDVAKAIHLSHEKYCSVHATLKAAVELTHDYEVIQTGDSAS
ncbi:MAG: OsmC family protein [Anaerolineae bacterium]|nr:OsmC family protein [Anaerolineae bacterium]